MFVLGHKLAVFSCYLPLYLPTSSLSYAPSINVKGAEHDGRLRSTPWDSQNLKEGESLWPQMAG
jgi:hypothetical protein